MNERFRREGFCVASIADAASWSAKLEQQRESIMASGTGNRPWVFWELHNPWSRASVNVDSWGLLDLCQSPAMIECLSDLMGEDIVLFDSQITPNPPFPGSARDEWRDDEHFFPLDRSGGVVVRLPCGSNDTRTFATRAAAPAQYSIGQIVIHRAGLVYRLGIFGPHEFEFVVRYFPATHRYIRDPAHPKQVLLTERYPWINYAKMPLWLVSGEDRADNDYVTGFHTKTGRWTTARPG